MYGNHDPVFAGIDIMRSSGRVRRRFVYAVLDAERELLVLAHGDQDEVLAYFGGQSTAWVAINAPHRPSNPSTRNNTRQVKASDQMVSIRQRERVLLEMGLKLTQTPETIKTRPGWMKNGFSLYEALEDLGYKPFPISESNYHLIETHAEAIFWRLLKHKSLLPISLEGRLQRQLLLHSIDMPVPDAMDFFLEITRFKLMQGELPDENLYIGEELNALAAAHVAWLAGNQPTMIELIGDLNEGQIALPATA